MHVISLEMNSVDFLEKIVIMLVLLEEQLLSTCLWQGSYNLIFVYVLCGGQIIPNFKHINLHD